MQRKTPKIVKNGERNLNYLVNYERKQTTCNAKAISWTILHIKADIDDS